MIHSYALAMRLGYDMGGEGFDSYCDGNLAVYGPYR